MLRTHLTRIVRLRWERQRDTGRALVLFALGLAGFCGLVGLSVDVGNLVTNRRGAQNDADVAALAAGWHARRQQPFEDPGRAVAGAD